MAMSDDTGESDVGDLKTSGPEKRGNLVEPGEIPAISPETVFGLLGDCHRRAVLDYLENTDDGQAPLSDLAAYVSQHDCAGNSPDHVTIQLHHSTLPKMAEAGLLTYDPETKAVQYIGHPLVEDCLNLVDSQ